MFSHSRSRYRRGSSSFTELVERWPYLNWNPPPARWPDHCSGAFLSFGDPHPDKLQGMKPEIEAVVRLQSVDERAAELRKQIEALPKHIADIERKLEAHTRQLEADKAALAANAKKRKSFEDDIKTHEAKMSKLSDQMSLAKTNEQYRAFQHEISWCKDAIRKAEDSILELMGEGEPLEVNVREAEKALAAEKKVVEREKEEARKRTADDQAMLSDTTEERAKLARQVDPKLLERYERARKRWGTGVSDATSGKCSECHIALRPQQFQDLKRGEDVLFCESCGRILFYNPPISLEHELHTKV
jgi:predicted  nucleic acid-binding Zn-ribbon protein